MIKVTSAGLRQQERDLADLEQNLLPYAMATALSRTAVDLKAHLQGEMKKDFDRPTPYTLNSLRTIPATKNRLEARVWFKNEADGAQPASVWLAPSVFGGQRRNKPAEKQLRERGILPAGKYLVPGAGADLDGFGNIRRSQITKAMSGIGGFTQVGYNANATDSDRSTRKGNARRYFVMMRAGEPIGIAERTGKGAENVKVILAFVGSPSYSKRLNFFEIADAFVVRQLPIRFDEAMRAMRGRFRGRR